ncbi:hypothetical protein ACFOQM_19905 [Paenibacillus sp. GCM10012307]|uniref:Uncharacterized protein n=1 Tax=Paenibacillus roseus TaxID=2798579 RepID=A0A934MQS9_9BACL|nr:hypothetical protein [Paenibacillus roseus]MBJ6363491.1 hypothetical protein [Paenibacillus roseus]
MSRKERFRGRGRAGRGRKMEINEQQVGEELPSRKNKHVSTKRQLTKLYYNLLIVLFVCLVVGLVLYGRSAYE